MERLKKICMCIMDRKIIGDQYNSVYNMFIELKINLMEYVALKECITDRSNDKKDKELIDKLTILQNDFQQHRL